MTVIASLWNGEGWATDGGKAKINWSYAPFKANFQSFSDSGCHADGGNINAEACGSTTYYWNTIQYSRLSANETTAFKNVRAKYVTYDYCSDKRSTAPPSRNLEHLPSMSHTIPKVSLLSSPMDIPVAGASVPPCLPPKPPDADLDMMLPVDPPDPPVPPDPPSLPAL
ncbi:hypothetical protein Bca52824_041535 [Brassica carinata]|uniref:Xyloglucan endo-transglycosylase C-terminal domain-containing protein n=1 Tax=Brassica carinata TaxID=52824 RepID=A0A8X7RVD2_BRACI|nr:hypothetical protein Bca52824_041535 [Brassica carinata]